MEVAGRDGFLSLLFVCLHCCMSVEYNLYIYNAEHQVTDLFI
jgi:hypothetical protein